MQDVGEGAAGNYDQQLPGTVEALGQLFDGSQYRGKLEPGQKTAILSISTQSPNLLRRVIPKPHPVSVAAQQ
jgi:hypothetical protein